MIKNGEGIYFTILCIHCIVHTAHGNREQRAARLHALWFQYDFVLRDNWGWWIHYRVLLFNVWISWLLTLPLTSFFICRLLRVIEYYGVRSFFLFEIIMDLCWLTIWLYKLDRWTYIIVPRSSDFGCCFTVVIFWLLSLSVPSDLFGVNFSR